MLSWSKLQWKIDWFIIVVVLIGGSWVFEIKVVCIGLVEAEIKVTN